MAKQKTGPQTCAQHGTALTSSAKSLLVCQEKGCGKSKPVGEFYSKGSAPNGTRRFESICKDCSLARKKRKCKMKRLSRLGNEKRRTAMIEVSVSDIKEVKAEGRSADLGMLDGLIRDFAFEVILEDK